MKNAEVVMASQDHRIHSFKKCFPEGSDYFQPTLGRRRSSSLNIKLSSSKEDPSINEAHMKISTLEELLIHLSIRIRNYAIMNEEVVEAEDSRRNIPMKQIKISIQLLFHDIVLLYI